MGLFVFFPSARGVDFCLWRLPHQVWAIQAYRVSRCAKVAHCFRRHRKVLRRSSLTGTRNSTAPGSQSRISSQGDADQQQPP